jgi:hypothetical protein
MAWTVIYNSIGGGLESFTMTSSHDGEKAWEDAEKKLLARFGPENLCKIFVLVKGSHPIFVKQPVTQM